MPVLSVNDEDIACLKRMVKIRRYMDRTATQYHTQLGILVPMRRKVFVMRSV